MNSVENKYNCVVIDDEFLARKLLAEYISKVPQLNLVGTFDSPLKTIGLFQNEKIDIVFLDIQMPDISGIDFIKNMSVRPLIIFVTAFPEYALQGFELDVIEYLVKPVSLPRFLKAVNKAINIADVRRKAELFEHGLSLNNRRQKNGQNFIIIKSERKIIKLSYDEIYFIEGALEYVNFQTKDKKFIGLFSLKDLENTLPAEQFMRVHKSYIISLNKINELDGNLIKLDKWSIPLSKSFRPKLLNYLERK